MHLKWTARKNDFRLEVLWGWHSSGMSDRLGAKMLAQPRISRKAPLELYTITLDVFWLDHKMNADSWCLCK